MLTPSNSCEIWMMYCSAMNRKSSRILLRLTLPLKLINKPIWEARGGKINKALLITLLIWPTLIIHKLYFMVRKAKVNNWMKRLHKQIILDFKKYNYLKSWKDHYCIRKENSKAAKVLDSRTISWANKRRRSWILVRYLV